MDENEIWERKQRSEAYKNVKAAQLAEAQRREIRRNAKLEQDKASLAKESVIKQEEEKLISEAKTSFEILEIQLRKIFERYEIKIENALDEEDEDDIIQKRDETCEKAIEKFPLSQIKDQTDVDDFVVKLFDLMEEEDLLTKDSYYKYAWYQSGRDIKDRYHNTCTNYRNEYYNHIEKNITEIKDIFELYENNFHSSLKVLFSKVREKFSKHDFIQKINKELEKYEEEMANDENRIDKIYEDAEQEEKRKKQIKTQDNQSQKAN